MIRIAVASLTAACLTIGGCGPSENDPAPGGVTVGEAKALDEAAEMIEQRRLPEGAVAPEDTGQSAAETGSEPPAAVD